MADIDLNIDYPVVTIRGYGSAGSFAVAAHDYMVLFELQSDGSYSRVADQDAHSDYPLSALVPFYEYILTTQKTKKYLRIYDISNVNSIQQSIETETDGGSDSYDAVRSGNGDMDAVYIVGQNKRLWKYNLAGRLLAKSDKYTAVGNAVIIHGSYVVMGTNNGEVVLFYDGTPPPAVGDGSLPLFFWLH